MLSGTTNVPLWHKKGVKLGHFCHVNVIANSEMMERQLINIVEKMGSTLPFKTKSMGITILIVLHVLPRPDFIS